VKELGHCARRQDRGDEFFNPVQMAASEMRFHLHWYVNLTWVEGYALIACISGMVPMICMTRLRL
jgi:hypothetical protein